MPALLAAAALLVAAAAATEVPPAPRGLRADRIRPEHSLADEGAAQTVFGASLRPVLSWQLAPPAEETAVDGAATRAMAQRAYELRLFRLDPHTERKVVEFSTGRVDSAVQEVWCVAHASSRISKPGHQNY
eukprot:SAG31_NODE_1732_length_7421_cov_10.241191_8_plen_131_part_00